MNLKQLLSVLISVALTSCTMPGKGNSLNETAKGQAETAVNLIEEKSLKHADTASVYRESDSVIVLGQPFTISKKAALPPIFTADSEFRKMEAQTLDDVVEYLNQKHAVYGLSFGFSTDAIDYLNRTTGGQGASSASGSDDSAGVDIETIFGSNGSGGIASESGITMNLELGKTNLKRFLDAVSARTNLWWRYDEGRVDFYRTETKTFPLDDFPLHAKLTSSISTSSSGGSGEGVSSNTSSSHTYSMDHDVGDVNEQITKALESILSKDEGSFSVSRALSIVTITDTPDRLKAAERYIKTANRIASRQITMEVEVWELITTDSSNYGVEGNLSYLGSKFGLAGSGLSNTDTNSWASLGAKLLDGPWKDTQLTLKALQGAQSLSLKKRTTATAPHNGISPIRFVRERAYAKDVTNTIDTGQSQASFTSDTTVNGVVLFVSPRLNSDGTIGVSVVTDLSALNSLETFNVSESVKAQQPDRTTSGLVTSKNIRSGNTALMTGFEQEVDTGENNSIFGKKWWMFGGNDTSEKARSILLIMVTPYLEDV